jgi:hypothetical protein
MKRHFPNGPLTSINKTEKWLLKQLLRERPRHAVVLEVGGDDCFLERLSSARCNSDTEDPVERL